MDSTENTVDDLLVELRDRGWGGMSETKQVEIHLDGDGVRVELRWNDEARSKWGQTTTSMFYEEAATLLEALVAVLPYAPDDEEAAGS